MNEVLYVEDSTTSQILMRKYIEGIAPLVIASTLNAAVQLLRERRFRLMIADYNFPEGNSLQLIQYVRASPMHHQMPVIVVSSSMDGPMLTRIVRAGANDGLPKPVRIAEFRAMVTRMLAAPYVRNLENPVIDVFCFQWRSHLGVHQFCPELNVMVTGATKEDANDQMRAALDEYRRHEGVTLGAITDELIVRHMVSF